MATVNHEHRLARAHHVPLALPLAELYPGIDLDTGLPGVAAPT